MTYDHVFSILQYTRLKCILTTSYVRRLGSRGMTQRDFSVLSNHFAAALSEMQIPQTIIHRTVAALQSLKRCCQVPREPAAVDVL
jgi:hypothetical protein